MHCRSTNTQQLSNQGCFSIVRSWTDLQRNSYREAEKCEIVLKGRMPAFQVFKRCRHAVLELLFQCAVGER